MPVNSTQGLWEFTVKGIAIGLDYSDSTNFDIVADTGTPVLPLPEKIVDAYYAQVRFAVYDKAVAGYNFLCGTALPDIIFDIGNYHAVVPGSFIQYSPIKKDSYSTFHQLFQLPPPLC